MKIKETVYLDHQATTSVDSHVLAEMIPYFSDSFGNPHSSDHYLGWVSSRAVEDAAARVARLIGADADEIIFTSGATESNNLALLGLGRRAVGGKRDRVLLSAIEHKCVLSVGRVLQEQYGFRVDLIPVDSEGFVDLSVLEEMLGEDVLAVSVMAVNNEIGTIQDIAQVSKLAWSRGAVVHCDAAQAPVAMNLEGIAGQSDIVSLSAHKMYGPKGIGVVYISRELQGKVEPLIYGGGQQDGLRSGTLPVPLCVGMGAAADLLAGDDAEDWRAELHRRRDAFVEKLSGLTWPVELNGPVGHVRHPGNANIRFVGFSAHDILSALQPRLAASTGSACTSGIPEPSYVLRAIGLDSDEAESSIRFSLGFGTSDEDVAEAVGLIEEILAKLSKAKAGALSLS
ncbi:cysteine desulfurase family protein [Nitrococcus mobilis]|uniref:Cysteine sulfinate desulfinase/cysteine desulfurase and related enzyme n=1 Tax=Nitrococcus mobilis Nb-231 TaxID=314278 RepID=A4BVK7_9GAMM|nr:cysteine desulfurase family protein [Nitrococcus mobilis]EAR20272.1 Cysteine sulfinate desulfinase/cysteine desulfurase and related enzyme [Nitrococcus mobilis Nb-231]